jgi:hypothetical protein
VGIIRIVEGNEGEARALPAHSLNVQTGYVLQKSAARVIELLYCNAQFASSAFSVRIHAGGVESFT